MFLLAARVSRQPLRPRPAHAPAAHHPLGAVAAAYTRFLISETQKPQSKRRYLIVHPLSGLGNRIHGLRAGLAIALATRRTFLIGGLPDGVLPDLFVPPFFPLTPEDAGFPALSRKRVKMGPARETGVYGFPSISVINNEANTLGRCVLQKRALDDCFKRGIPKVLELYTNAQLDSRLFFQRSKKRKPGRLRSGREALGLASALGVAPTENVWAHLATYALFGVPSRLLAAEVKAVKVQVKWELAPAHGVRRIGVHARLFVDNAPTRVKSIPASFWKCVRAKIEAAVGGNATSEAHRPLIYYASDRPNTVAAAQAELGHLGRVVSAGQRKFSHSASGTAKHALPGATDWALLAECDHVLGTRKSTFAQTASELRGVPFVAMMMSSTGEC